MRSFAVLIIFVIAVVSLETVFCGTLYGLAPIVSQLVKIDPTTAKTTNVGPAFPHELQAQQLSSIDVLNKILYWIAFNDSSNTIQLLGADVTNGKIIYSLDLPFASEAFVGVGQTCNVIPGTSDVIVTGHDKYRKNLHLILRVTPKTGKTEKITSVGGVDVLGGASAVDPKYNILWIELGTQDSGIFLYGLDISTGKQLYKLDNSENMETIDYDSQTNLLYGIGLHVYNSKNYTRTLVTLDSKTGEIKVIAEIPGYFIIQSDVATIDPVGRELYAFLQPVGPSSGPFELLTINMNTAAIKSHPVACTNPSKCPWSLDFLP